MRAFFTPRWILTTLLVLAAVGVLIRLGFWQVERLEQRRAFNRRVLTQQSLPPFDFNRERTPADGALFDMEYRQAIVQGSYDHSQEVLLRNQIWQNQLGFHVLTPLQITGSSQAILVDRGWVPFDQATPARRARFNEPGTVTVRGVLRRPQTRPDLGGVPDPTFTAGETRLDAWNIVNLERIRQQVNLPLLAVYLQQAPEPGWERLPYRSQPELELSEGPHQGYALQWFFFAALLAGGYPVFVRRQLHSASSTTGPKPAAQGREYVQHTPDRLS